MIKKAFIFFASGSLIVIAANCTSQTAPGDTGVETRTMETDREPGNILAEGRVEAVER